MTHAMALDLSSLLRLEILQDLASAAVSRLHPSAVHNLEKYHALYKVHYMSAIEECPGDYLEFGVFGGSSFCHSIRCCRRLARIKPRVLETRFFGFDSFRGFGPLPEGDRHPSYTDDQFVADVASVERRVRRVGGGFAHRLVPGFFRESLRPGAAHYGIEKSRIVFVDSDTYSSATEALAFCLPTVQEGTFFVLDDYFAWRGSDKRGVACAFAEFVARAGLRVRQVFSYGMGGAVYVVAEAPAGPAP